MGHSLARKSRAELRSISCSSLKPKSMSCVPLPRVSGCSCRPRLPEVVVEAAALVDLPEGQLEGHADLDPLGLAVRDLAVEPPAAVEIDDGVRHGRVRALEEVVVGEGEERAPA